MYDSWHIHRIVVVVYVDEVRQCLRTAATSGHIVHPPGDISMESHGEIILTG
jgi:hypothetical protein